MIFFCLFKHFTIKFAAITFFTSCNEHCRKWVNRMRKAVLRRKKRGLRKAGPQWGDRRVIEGLKKYKGVLMSWCHLFCLNHRIGCGCVFMQNMNTLHFQKRHFFYYKLFFFLIFLIHMIFCSFIHMLVCIAQETPLNVGHW